MVDEAVSPLVFPEAFYLATMGGGAFFGKVGCFVEGYQFDAVVMDDSALPHPKKLTLATREWNVRFIWGWIKNYGEIRRRKKDWNIRRARNAQKTKKICR